MLDLADVEPMLFIAMRSDSKDGAVPPEPVGPMEVAGCEGQDHRGTHKFIDRFKLHLVSGNINQR